jgi:hypothetical protein
MSSSTTTIAPTGQQHDREDADMANGGGMANSELQEPPVASSVREPTNAVAMEAAAVDDDAMDTTPDTETALVPSSDSAVPPEAAVTPESPPASEMVTGTQPDNGSLLLPVVAPDDAVRMLQVPLPALKLTAYADTD